MPEASDRGRDANGDSGSQQVTEVDPHDLRRAVAAAALGNAMEWFDYGVFAYLAVTLGKVFFPSGSPSTQLLATFSTFAAALILRPFGGIVLGPLGDRLGRQKMLAFTMIMMAIATLSVGLIPSYNTIGTAAPILLLAARIVQGFSAGGEYGGATTFIAEYAPDRRRGFMGSWLEFGTLAGFVLGSAVVTALTAILGPQTMVSWGWRIPFLIAAPLGSIGLYARLRLEETPAFRRHRGEHGDQEADDAKEQIRRTVLAQWQPLLICVGLVIVFNVPDYFLLSALPSYLTTWLHFGETKGLMIVLVVMLLMMVVITFAGRLSDRVGRRPVLGAGCAGFLLLSIPCLLLIRHGTTVAIFGGALVLGMMLVCFTSTMPSALPALFPTGVRYGSLSLGFNVSVSLFGGTTPLVVNALIKATGSTLAPAYYLMAAAIIGGIAVFLMSESASRPLKGSSPTVETEAAAA